MARSLAAIGAAMLGSDSRESEFFLDIVLPVRWDIIPEAGRKSYREKPDRGHPPWICQMEDIRLVFEPRETYSGIKATQIE
jgi:hypothetical protein